MKAARLHPNATSLVVEDIPEPELRPGSVIVRLEAAFVPYFITGLIDGSGDYITPPRPFTPGMDAIGIVEKVADDIRGVAAGDRVYCDNYFEARDAGTDAGAFLGNFAMGEDAASLLDAWRDGDYAEKVCLPAECAIPIRFDPGVSPFILCRLGWLGTAYSALKKIGVAPGAVIAVNGASGALGCSAVVVALALGAREVFAIGRRQEAVDAVAAIDPRVVPVTNPTAIPGVDCVLNSADGADSSTLEAILPRIRRRGGLVAVGAPKTPLTVSLGWLLAKDITLRGSLWFERGQIGEILQLARAGRLVLSAFEAEVFALGRISDALAAARRRLDPRRHVAITFG